MADKTEINARLTFWKNALERAQTAYITLLDGGVQSYTLDGRQLTKLDLASLKAQIEDMESKVDELTALANGKKARRAYAIVPRDL
ncbi:hypothetical protein RFF05_06745 [Bengtsoniella intestinalis]|uniref:hypothetical protein n=1 Tax=Bengtsoniella intestinalis TaxID=3073143 RepID=UPI00391F068C